MGITIWASSFVEMLARSPTAAHALVNSKRQELLDLPAEEDIVTKSDLMLYFDMLHINPI